MALTVEEMGLSLSTGDGCFVYDTGVRSSLVQEPDGYAFYLCTRAGTIGHLAIRNKGAHDLNYSILASDDLTSPESVTVAAGGALAAGASADWSGSVPWRYLAAIVSDPTGGGSVRVFGAFK